NPRNAADWLESVVPVLPATAPVHPAYRAAAAAVPVVVSSDSAWPTARATPAETSDLQPRPGSGSDPPGPVIRSTGCGAHQTPSEASVAATLDSSSGLTAVGPSENDPDDFIRSAVPSSA